jgi:hypothetical protein
MQRAAALFTIADLSQMVREWQSKHRGRRYWRPRQAELYPGARVGLVQAGNLGDVVHTLPMAGAIKAACPTATIVFIGRRYTESLVRASRYVDEFSTPSWRSAMPTPLPRKSSISCSTRIAGRKSRVPRRALACRCGSATFAVAIPSSSGAIASSFMAAPEPD